MSTQRPDFIIIGAMKSATTTLHEQLARQPGIFIAQPQGARTSSVSTRSSPGLRLVRVTLSWAEPGSLS